MSTDANASPLDAVTWPLRTARLTIRPARPEDVDALWAYRRLEEVSRWLTSFPADRPDWDRMFAEPERLTRTLVVEHDGVVVGDLYLHVEDAWGQREVLDRCRNVQAEIGWCLHPDHTGQGFATEAAHALLGACFDQLRLHRVVANAFADNEASWRLMERLGMRRETWSVRDSYHRERGWLDGVSYALLADEWETARPA